MSNENDADSGGGLALVAEKKGGRSHRRTRFAKKTPAPSLSGVGSVGVGWIGGMESVRITLTPSNS
jgi:hypothetical protein